MEEKITTYKGIDIRKLSKEELIKALEFAIEMMKNQRERHAKDMEMLRLFNGRQDS